LYQLLQEHGVESCKYWPKTLIRLPFRVRDYVLSFGICAVQNVRIAPMVSADRTDTM